MKPGFLNRRPKFVAVCTSPAKPPKQLDASPSLTEPSELIDGGVLSSLPPETIYLILTRLPAKSLCQFKCVSKLWKSNISDHRFVAAHHRLSATHRDGASLLITVPGASFNRPIYALNHGGTPDAIHLLNIPMYLATYISKSVHGLICLEEDEKIRISNPSTRELVTLPLPDGSCQSNPWTGHLFVTSFGYDPVKEQHKVLNTRFMQNEKNRMITKHRVFVLGSSSWRRIIDGPPHLPRRMESVCISGAIYYRAWTSMVDKRPKGGEVLVRFGVNNEAFEFIKIPTDGSDLDPLSSGLIRFDNDCVAVVDYKNLKSRNSVEMWVLDNYVKQTWVHKTISFSSEENWLHLLEEQEFFLAGTVRTGEMVIAPYTLKKPVFLFFLNLKMGSVRKVEIGSLSGSWSRLSSVYCNITLTDHVESVLSLASP